MKERLQKILAQAGLASRRDSEQLILSGRVTVNGEVVTQLGSKADVPTDVVAVDGRPVLPPAKHLYIMLNKPSGYLTTVQDERGRPTVMDLLPKDWPRIFPVGRLDLHTQGLLLLTNDGEFANLVLHPRYVLDKEYLAQVEGRPSREAIEGLRRGIEIDGIRTAPARVETVSTQRDASKVTSWVRVIIHEGRKRQVRRMLEAVGHPVLRLIRTRVGPLTLDKLPVGAHRNLTAEEVRSLVSSPKQSGAKARQASPSRGASEPPRNRKKG